MDIPIEFPLYLSSAKVIEDEKKNILELELIYEGDETLVDKLLLIGQNNGLSKDLDGALQFKMEKERGRVLFRKKIPVYEDGSFQAVVEYESKYIYEPGEQHALVFRGKAVFLDLRKIYHIKSVNITKPKDVDVQKEEISKQPQEKAVKEEGLNTLKGDIANNKTKANEKVSSSLPLAYDEKNVLKLKPKDFRTFDVGLKEKLLQVLDYLSNENSKKLIHDAIILPEIARSLKILIAEEQRATVFDICFPVVILIEKALMLSSMVYEVIIDDELYERYNNEVANKIPEIKEKIENSKFIPSNAMITVEYNNDVHELVKRFYSSI